MRMKCHEWLDGFTVGSIYRVSESEPGKYYAIDDDGYLHYLNQKEMILYFEEAAVCYG